MAENDTSLGLKEKLFDFVVKTTNSMTKANTVSTFLQTGKITPEEASIHLSIIFWV